MHGGTRLVSIIEEAHKKTGEEVVVLVDDMTLLCWTLLVKKIFLIFETVSETFTVRLKLLEEFFVLYS